jgi:hypothetical protein
MVHEDQEEDKCEHCLLVGLSIHLIGVIHDKLVMVAACASEWDCPSWR